jgi:salicylate hydroxylase
VKRLHGLVIGAGIGGMAAAIALRRAGLEVSLFEQTVAQREVGAGIQISPNASRLLGRYGLGDAMARWRSVPPRSSFVAGKTVVCWGAKNCVTP